MNSTFDTLNAYWTKLVLHLRMLSKTYVFWLSVVGVFGPSSLQWAVENIEFLALVLKLDDANKEFLRITILALIPLARAMPQKSVAAARKAIEEAA